MLPDRLLCRCFHRDWFFAWPFRPVSLIRVRAVRAWNHRFVLCQPGVQEWRLLLWSDPPFTLLDGRVLPLVDRGQARHFLRMLAQRTWFYAVLGREVGEPDRIRGVAPLLLGRWSLLR